MNESAQALADTNSVPDTDAFTQIASRVRRASILILIGLAIELLAFLYWTPATFIAFAAVGLTLIFFGVALYFIVVLGHLRRQKAL